MSLPFGKIVFVPTIVACFLLAIVTSAHAAKDGVALLFLRDANTGQSEILAAIGDTLTIEVMVSAREELITGVIVFFTLDEEVLQLVSQNSNNADPVPFAQGTYVRGVVFENNTILDRVGEEDANGIPGFQLRYFENIQSFSAGPTTGEGVLATFKVLVVGLGRQYDSAIQIDRISPIGSETGYFRAGDPGTTYAFRTAQSLDLTVAISAKMADFNGDRVVDFDDFLSFAAAFGTENQIHDLDGSGLVDFQDFLHFAERFGQSY